MGFYCSFIYGFNSASERESLWSTSCTLASLISTTWVIMVDFNAIMEIVDRIDSPVRLSDIQPMRNCIAVCQLTEVKTMGRLYTWNNKQDGIINKMELIGCFPELIEFSLMFCGMTCSIMLKLCTCLKVPIILSTYPSS